MNTMMLRATVVGVDEREPARVWVMIPQKYGDRRVRVFTRVQVREGDHVYVTNTSPSRVPQWVVFGQLSEIGRWGEPYPHEHPIGQVVGLKDWLTQYEAWMGDHTARLDAADKRIADGKAAVDQARADLAQAQTDLADAVRRVAIQRTDLDAAVVRLDQTERNVLAAGTRISANETALATADKRLESAETTLQVAKTDLGELKNGFGDVQAKAATADQRASDAFAKASAAVASANGKNSLTRDVNPASQPGGTVGDVHWTMSSMGGGGAVIRQQRWDGSTWQDEVYGHQVFGSVDLGKATVGELDGIRIKAGSIAADRVIIGQGENLIPDAAFLSDITTAARTAGTSWRVTSRADGMRVFTTNSTVQDDVPLTSSPSGWMQIDPSGKYQMTMVIAGPNQMGVYLVMRMSDGSIVTTGSEQRIAVPPQIGTVRAEWDLAALGSPVAIRPMLRRYPTPAGATNFYTQVGAVTLRRKINTVLIEDGAVTGEKVEAHSVAGEIGRFLKVEAQSGTFTDTLTGRNARLLGETVAESINITGKLRGRDAILSGTVDIGQLNVTGTMSAKIINTATLAARQGFFTDGLTANEATLLGTTVAEKLVVTGDLSTRVANAMTVNAKRVIVTDDAILNRATIVQSLVTPELIASKVDARYLRADNIKTGLLEVFGRFRTAPDGQPQIIIQPSQAAWNSADLAVWFTPDGTTPGGGNAMSYPVTGGMWMNPAGGGGRSESLWTAQQLNLRGQSRAGVRIMDGLTVQSTAGTVGPTINTPNGQFLNVIGQGGVGITTLNGDARITPWGGIDMLANNGNVFIQSTPSGSEVRLHAGSGGYVRFTNGGSNTASYSVTTSAAANMNMDGRGNLYRTTSSRRYKKHISPWTFDVTKLRGQDVLSRWRDRKQPGQDEDMRWHHGAIAETIAELWPEVVPTIPDPKCVDKNGNVADDAPQIPDSIEYDRLALAIAVAGWQDTDQRLTQAHDTITSLEQRVAALEGATA